MANVRSPSSSTKTYNGRREIATQPQEPTAWTVSRHRLDSMQGMVLTPTRCLCRRLLVLWISRRRLILMCLVRGCFWCPVRVSSVEGVWRTKVRVWRVWGCSVLYSVCCSWSPHPLMNIGLSKKNNERVWLLLGYMYITWLEYVHVRNVITGYIVTKSSTQLPRPIIIPCIEKQVHLRLKPSHWLCYYCLPHLVTYEPYNHNIVMPQASHSYFSETKTSTYFILSAVHNTPMHPHIPLSQC